MMIHKHAYILVAVERDKYRHMRNEARINIYQYIDRYKVNN